MTNTWGKLALTVVRPTMPSSSAGHLTDEPLAGEVDARHQTLASSVVASRTFRRRSAAGISAVSVSV